MRYSEALEAVWKGEAIRLSTWKEDVKIRCMHWNGVDSTAKMTHPYLYVESRNGNVPWINTVVELFSDDWEIVKSHKK